MLAVVIADSIYGSVSSSSLVYHLTLWNVFHISQSCDNHNYIIYLSNAQSAQKFIAYSKKV